MLEKNIARLQRVRNLQRLARVATKATRFSRSVPILKRLQSLASCQISHIFLNIRNNPTRQPACISERDMAQWLERGALPMSLPAVRFQIPLGAGFSEKYHASPIQILGHC